MNCKKCGAQLDPSTGLPDDTAEHREIERLNKKIDDYINRVMKEDSRCPPHDECCDDCVVCTNKYWRDK